MPARQPITAVGTAAVLLSAGLAWSPASPAQTGGVSITSYGQSVLLNPFKAVGCAAGLPEPRVSANVILASSELPDEGARTAKGTYLVKPGSYRVGSLKLEGFGAPHDRIGGRRFGQATLWRWQQGGLSFAHLGGTAAKLSGEDKVLLGRPDVLIIGVGGGGKVYDGKEAAEVIQALNPRRVIPVQYVSGTAPAGCDQGDIQPFLDALGSTSVQRVGTTLNLPASLGDTTVVNVMR